MNPIKSCTGARRAKRKRVTDEEMGKFVKQLLRADREQRVAFWVDKAGYFWCQPCSCQS